MGRDFLERVVGTMAFATLGTTALVAPLGNVNWLGVAAIAAIATAITVLKSVAAGEVDDVARLWEMTKRVLSFRWARRPRAISAANDDLIFHWFPDVQEAYSKVIGIETPKCFCLECGDEGAYVDFHPPKALPGPPPRSRGWTAPMTAVASSVASAAYQQRGLHPIPFEGLSGSSLNPGNSLSAAQWNTYVQDQIEYGRRAQVKRAVQLQKRRGPIRTAGTRYVFNEAFVEVDGVDLSCFVSCVEIHETSSILLNLVFLAEPANVLEPLWRDEAEFGVNIRPDRVAPVSSNNAEYSTVCKVLEYHHLSSVITLEMQEPLSRSTGSKQPTTADLKPLALTPAPTYNNGTVAAKYPMCAVCDRPPQDTRYIKFPGEKDLYVVCVGCMQAARDIHATASWFAH